LSEGAQQRRTLAARRARYEGGGIAPLLRPATALAAVRLLKPARSEK
jgi:hypothetical protein